MKILQIGRSMIEMLGVLAIIGVLSIGGIVLYRRAVNNHQANVILDDVNRFAFVILERSGLALGKVIPNGDFVESGIYQLEGYQDVEPNQFSITVKNVPKGVCEALLPKAIIEYKVRVNPTANEKGKLYDTLNTDLCLDNNFIVFYFGDTTGVCNVPDDDGPTPCTQNSDCCGGDFCFFEKPRGCYDNDERIGICKEWSSFFYRTATTETNGEIKEWTVGNAVMPWYSAQNWCAAKGLSMINRESIGCKDVTGSCASDIVKAIKSLNLWYDYFWLERVDNSCNSFSVGFRDKTIYQDLFIDRHNHNVMCH